MKFLVTAGPTREPIDPVRFLSNRSSGRMGYALAEAARAAGHEVTLVSGPVALPAPAGVEVTRVETAAEMLAAVRAALHGAEVVILCAAVADYRPRTIATRKLKKTEATMVLELERTTDILAEIAAAPRSFLLAGFAAETNDVAENARRKLAAKGCDAIVANDVSGTETGMESDENEVEIFFREGASRKIPRASKQKIARELVKLFFEMHQKSLTKNS